MSYSDSIMSLSQSLLASTAQQRYDAAVKHPFLQAAGERTLNAELLSLWLSQDRIYAAHAYPRVIGSLISKIPFSSHHTIGGPEEGRNNHLLAVLTYALQNVVREANFFLDTSKKYGLDLDCWKERPETRSYTAEMTRVASQGSLEEGLVFLWAMEKVYLDAWSYVAGLPRNPSFESSTFKAGQALKEFEKNWTNDEFKKFVDDLRDIVDNLGIQPGSELWTRAEMVWDRVLELEVGFWPNMGEDKQNGAKKEI